MVGVNDRRGLCLMAIVVALIKFCVGAPLFFEEVSFGGRQKSFSGGIKGEGNSDDRGVNGG